MIPNLFKCGPHQTLVSWGHDSSSVDELFFYMVDFQAESKLMVLLEKLKLKAQVEARGIYRQSRLKNLIIKTSNKKVE